MLATPRLYSVVGEIGCPAGVIALLIDRSVNWCMLVVAGTGIEVGGTRDAVAKPDGVDVGVARTAGVVITVAGGTGVDADTAVDTGTSLTGTGVTISGGKNILITTILKAITTMMPNLARSLLELLAARRRVA